MLLSFADDIAIIVKTPTEIHNYLYNLSTYCNHWGLHANIVKAKIMVFRKRGGVLSCERWNYNGQLMKAVNYFNYLGVVFNLYM